MPLHDRLAELVQRTGPAILDDADEFRAVFDDVVPEGEATNGELTLLVDAIRFGALRRSREQFALGGDPATVIDAQGDRLAEDRGTAESDGARWALATLCFALGVVPADLVRTRPAPPSTRGSVSLDMLPTEPVPTDPTTDGPTLPLPPPPSSPDAGGPARRDEGRRGTSNPLRRALVAVAAIVAIVGIVVAVVALTDDDPASPTDEPTAATTSGDEDRVSTASGGPSGSTDDVAPTGELITNATADLTNGAEDFTALVTTDQDGTTFVVVEHADTVVGRDRLACPYTADSKPIQFSEMSGAGEFSISWTTSTGGEFAEYVGVVLAEEKVDAYGIDAGCP